MEHSIGTKITLEDGRVVEVVEVSIGHGCKGCALNAKYRCVTPRRWICDDAMRTDHKNIIYKEVKEE